MHIPLATLSPLLHYFLSIRHLICETVGRLNDILDYQGISACKCRVHCLGVHRTDEFQIKAKIINDLHYEFKQEAQLSLFHKIAIAVHAALLGSDAGERRGSYTAIPESWAESMWRS